MRCPHFKLLSEVPGNSLEKGCGRQRSGLIKTAQGQGPFPKHADIGHVIDSQNNFLKVCFLKIYLVGRVTERGNGRGREKRRERYIQRDTCCFIPQMATVVRDLGLSQAEARTLELHLSLPHD